jgi:hypothetical protein
VALVRVPLYFRHLLPTSFLNITQLLSESETVKARAREGERARARERARERSSEQANESMFV